MRHQSHLVGTHQAMRQLLGLDFQIPSGPSSRESGAVASALRGSNRTLRGLGCNGLRYGRVRSEELDTATAEGKNSISNPIVLQRFLQGNPWHKTGSNGRVPESRKQRCAIFLPGNGACYEQTTVYLWNSTRGNIEPRTVALTSP